MKEERDHFQRPDGSDPLDQLLREALWTPPPEAAEERLKQRWQTAWSAQLRRQIFLRRAAGLAVAASVVAAATVGWHLLHPANNLVVSPEPVSPRKMADGHVPSVVGQPPATHRTNKPVMSPTVTNEIASIGPAPPSLSSTRVSHELSLAEAPTRLEQIMLEAMDRRREARRNAGRSKSLAVAIRKEPASNDETAVQSAIECLVNDPNTDPATAATALRSAPAIFESYLIAMLSRADVARQHAALRLLGEIGSSASVPYLLDAIRNPDLHAVAAGVLSRLADTATVQELARREANLDLQRVLLAALLARGDSQSVISYLAFVENEESAAVALAAAASLKDPPLETLFAVLHGMSVPQRIAAARVIGRVDGPAATRRLIAMVEQGTSRQEACVALLSSRGDDAVRYVTTARNDLTLSPILQAASVFVVHNSQPRS